MKNKKSEYRVYLIPLFPRRCEPDWYFSPMKDTEKAEIKKMMKDFFKGKFRDDFDEK